MNKNIIMGAAAGLLLGVGGGTAFVVMTKPDSPPAGVHMAADSLAADSSAHALAGDSAHATTDSSAAHVVASSPADAGHAPATASAHGESGEPAPATPPQTRSAASPARDSTSVRLGRIFGAMKPEDAAAVLSRLDDAEVKAVLFQLSDRKAAEILARFPGDRAANLTKTLLTDARAH